MAKSKNLRDSKDKEAYRILSQELSRFNNIVKGHEKLLEAIAKL
jgi:hypothetical protein